MLTHPTFEQLRNLKLTGMLKALQEQEQMPNIDQLSFLKRLGLLVDREIQKRDNRRLTTRLRFFDICKVFLQAVDSSLDGALMVEAHCR
ncbi:hypothetical protein JCM19379_03160 [Methyloparacoccus murrellii]